MVDLTVELREREGIVLEVTRLYKGGLFTDAAASDDVLATGISTIVVSTLLEVVIGGLELLVLLLAVLIIGAGMLGLEADKLGLEVEAEAPSEVLLSWLRATFEGRLSHSLALILTSLMASRAAWFFDKLW